MFGIAPKTDSNMSDNGSTRADTRLSETIIERLNECEPIESVGFQIDVTSDDGNVALNGHVRSDVHRGLAARLVSEVNGVRSVQNNLVSDAKMRSRVAGALAKDPGLAKLMFNIESNLGEIRVGGNVTDTAILDHVRELALSVDGVVGVTTAATAE